MNSTLPSLAEIEAAAEIVYREFAATPQYRWATLSQRLGTECWVKHENHTPVGAFKIRGGLTYFDALRQHGALPREVISATRGNHGQSMGWAARAHGVACTIVVPRGNSVEKNAAMRALGAELIETGHDLEAARETAMELAKERGLDFIPSFGKELVMGVSTYAHELFRAAGELDAVYVPIGMGSGIVGTIAARDMLGLRTKVIGVVAEGANAVALSFAAGKPVSTNTASSFADGMAVRVVNPDAFAHIQRGADRIVTVSEDEIAESVRLYFRCCHTIAEGAGAAPLAALLKERQTMKGQRVGVILSGGNIDMPKFAEVLEGKTPAA